MWQEQTGLVHNKSARVQWLIAGQSSQLTSQNHCYSLSQIRTKTVLKAPVAVQPLGKWWLRQKLYRWRIQDVQSGAAQGEKSILALKAISIFIWEIIKCKLMKKELNNRGYVIWCRFVECTTTQEVSWCWAGESLDTHVVPSGITRNIMSSAFRRIQEVRRRLLCV